MVDEKKEQEQLAAEHKEDQGVEVQPDPMEEIARLRAELQKATEEAKENYDRLLRAVAELENYKKRVAKEKTDLIRYGNEELLKALLPVIDNLERALAHAKDADDKLGIREGVEMTLQQFLQVLQRFGVTQICAEGERFDPSRHEAIMERVCGDHPPGHVVAEIERGYMLNDRLVRPAKVVVAKAPGDAEQDKDLEGQDLSN